MTDITYKNTSIIEYVYSICPPPGWEQFFAQENVKNILAGIDAIISKETCEIYPSLPYLMYALFLTPPEKIKLIILGQDPYHGPGQAMGLAFSVPKNVPIPSSLQNIYKELKNEGLIDTIPTHGKLTHLSKQGVFLINTALTVRQGNANSHKLLWKEFTDELITYIDLLPGYKIAILLGANAQEYSTKLSCKKIFATHPSGLSAYKPSRVAPAFIGSGVFKQANELFAQNGETEIKY